MISAYWLRANVPDANPDRDDDIYDEVEEVTLFHETTDATIDRQRWKDRESTRTNKQI